MPSSCGFTTSSKHFSCEPVAIGFDSPNACVYLVYMLIKPVNSYPADRGCEEDERLAVRHETVCIHAGGKGNLSTSCMYSIYSQTNMVL